MNSIREYIIKQGDTIQSIAQNVLGNIDKAFEIAILNSLEYPFILDHSTKDSIKTPGDIILLPLEAFPYENIDDLEISVFGSDLILENKEFNTNSQEDLETLTGVECLKQDLVHRLSTEMGSLIYHPEYGSNLSEIVGNKKDTDWGDKAKIELVRTLRCDDRVIDIRNADITSVPTGVHISCNVITPNLEFILNETIGGAKHA